MNVATNTIVVIVLLEYGGTLVAEDSGSLSFSEMTCEKIHCLATGCQRREGKRMMDQASLMQAIHRNVFRLTISLVRHPASKTIVVTTYRGSPLWTTAMETL